MEDKVLILKKEVLEWPKRLLLLGKDVSFWAHTSPDGGIYIDEDYVKAVNRRQGNPIKCEDCKHWCNPAGGVKGYCMVSIPRKITTILGGKFNSYPKTYHTDSCDDAESK